jgi:hypothetical protein
VCTASAAESPWATESLSTGTDSIAATGASAAMGAWLTSDTGGSDAKGAGVSLGIAGAAASTGAAGAAGSTPEGLWAPALTRRPDVASAATWLGDTLDDTTYCQQ